MLGSCSEVYLEKALDGTGWRPAERLPIARELGETSILFLVHPTLTQTEGKSGSENRGQIPIVLSFVHGPWTSWRECGNSRSI